MLSNIWPNVGFPRTFGICDQVTQPPESASEAFAITGYEKFQLPMTQLTQSLTHLLNRHRIVFWYDEKDRTATVRGQRALSPGHATGGDRSGRRGEGELQPTGVRPA